MTLCKYFLNGNCRYGGNCRFEHVNPYYASNNRQYREDGGNRGDNRKTDSYHWQKSGGGNSSASEIERIIVSIRDEIIAMENGNMWPLTCFAPVIRSGNLRGWEDYSPEEVRLEMIKAFQSGTVETYKKIIESLHNACRERRHKLKVCSRETIESIKEYMKSTPETNSNPASTSVFQSTPSVFGNTAASQNFSFASAFSSNNTNVAQQTAASTFSFSQGLKEPASVFGQTSNSKNQPSIFGHSQATQSNSAFGHPQPRHSTPSSAFEQNQATSIFSQNQANVFGNPNSSAPHSIFGNSAFNAAAEHSGFNSPGGFQSNTGPNSFQQGTGSIFGGNNFPQSNSEFQQNVSAQSFQVNTSFSNSNVNFQQGLTKVVESNQPYTSLNSNVLALSIFSTLESLLPEEVAAFECPTFKFKHIPLNAPPENLCH